MIIHDLDVFRSLIAPPEYDPPLIVDPDRMLANEVTSQSFQPIAWRRRKITEHSGIVQLHQFSTSDLGEIRRKFRRNASLPKINSANVPRKVLITRATYHATIPKLLASERSLVGLSFHGEEGPRQPCQRQSRRRRQAVTCSRKMARPERFERPTLRFVV
jgi:hypothetical protein